MSLELLKQIGRSKQLAKSEECIKKTKQNFFLELSIVFSNITNFVEMTGKLGNRLVLGCLVGCANTDCVNTALTAEL